MAEQRGLLEEQREIRQAAQHARQEAAAALGRLLQDAKELLRLPVR